jgi:protein-disulfide isomerase
MTGVPTPRLKLVAVMMIVVLAGFGVGSALDWMRLPGTELDDTPTLSQLLNDDAAPSAGPAAAPLTVVVFTDYRCAVCRVDQPALAEVIASEPRVRFVFKEWAILGPTSREAARVALAAAHQGRYLEVRSALMAADRLDGDGISKAVVAAGADWARLQNDLSKHAAEIQAELARTSRQGFALGLPGTPSYLIGHRLVVGRLTEAKLRRLIRRTL